MPEVLKTVWTMYRKRWYDRVSCTFHGFFEDEKESKIRRVCLCVCAGGRAFLFLLKRNSGSRKLPAVAIEVVLHGIHKDQ